jgi:hypothetical protein
VEEEKRFSYLRNQLMQFERYPQDFEALVVQYRIKGYKSNKK